MSLEVVMLPVTDVDASVSCRILPGYDIEIRPVLDQP
jgi:hypothetical protein